MKVKAAQSCLTLCGPKDYAVHGILQPGTLDWAAFPFSRGSSQLMDQNPGLPHCRILNQLSYEGSPRILEFIAYPLSRGSSRPRNQTEVSRWALYILPKASGTLITHGELITGITMSLLIQTRLAVTPTSTVHEMSGDSCLSTDDVGSCFYCICYISELSPHLVPFLLCTNPPWGHISFLHLHKPICLCLSQFLSLSHTHTPYSHTCLMYIIHAYAQPCTHVTTCTHTVHV